MDEPLISNKALWAACAHSVADLLHNIARDEVQPRWQLQRVDTKADGSLISEADTAVQRILASMLPTLYPAPLLGEEGTTEELHLYGNSTNTLPALWIADPIDGTTNFVSGLPWYAISVALVHQGTTVVAVTYAPALKCLWLAALGSGAYLNGQRLQLGKSPTSLRDALVGIDMTYLPASLRQAIARCSPSGLSRDADQPAPWRGWRSLGASTLEWCALASGQLQAYVHGGQMPWDAAAGRLILSEAGGFSAPLTELLGQPSCQTSPLQACSYAGAAPGIWDAWQDWLRLHSR